MFIIFLSFLWFNTTIALTLFCWLEFHRRHKKLLGVCNFNKLLHIGYIYSQDYVFFVQCEFFPLY
jgi:hypothetical protein